MEPGRMERAKAIHIDDLVSRAEKAAGEMLSQRLKWRPGKVEIGFVPGSLINGIIIRDFDLGEVAAAELIDMSSRLAEVIAGPNARPGLTIGRDIITMGFFPIDGPIIARELRI